MHDRIYSVEIDSQTRQTRLFSPIRTEGRGPEDDDLARDNPLDKDQAHDGGEESEGEREDRPPSSPRPRKGARNGFSCPEKERTPERKKTQEDGHREMKRGQQEEANSGGRAEAEDIEEVQNLEKGSRFEEPTTGPADSRETGIVDPREVPRRPASLRDLLGIGWGKLSPRTDKDASSSPADRPPLPGKGGSDAAHADGGGTNAGSHGDGNLSRLDDSLDASPQETSPPQISTEETSTKEPSKREATGRAETAGSDESATEDSSNDSAGPQEPGPREPGQHAPASGSSTKSHLVTEMDGNYKQRDLINETVRASPTDIREPYRAFVLHLLAQAKIYGLDHWCPIPARTLVRDLPGGWTLRDGRGGTSRLWTFEESAVQCRNEGAYSYHRHHSREYRIEPAFGLQFESLAGAGDPNYQLQRENTRARGSSTLATRLRDPAGHRWGQETGGLPGGAYSLVDGALRVLSETEHRLDIAVIEKASTAYKKTYENAKRRHGLLSTDETAEVLNTVKGRYHAVQSGYTAILRQARRIEDGVASIQNAYKVQPLSGRLTFRRGGPQGLPATLKALAYDLEEVYNYDIKSSQTVGLRHLAGELQALDSDVDTRPLDDYLAKGGKDWASLEHDLPRGLVKVVEHAVKFGAIIPASMKAAASIAEVCGRVPRIAELVETYYETREKQDEALKKLKEIFGPQVQMIKTLAGDLLTTYWDAHKQRGGRGKGWTMRNACGMTFCPHDYREEKRKEDGRVVERSYGHRARSKAMAWYLQGLEAALVHAVTLGSTEHDYTVMANEHDGCITMGRIPAEAKEQARELSGFQSAELVQKPFEDDEDVRDFCRTHGLDLPSYLL